MNLKNKLRILLMAIISAVIITVPPDVQAKNAVNIDSSGVAVKGYDQISPGTSKKATEIGPGS